MGARNLFVSPRAGDYRAFVGACLPATWTIADIATSTPLIPAETRITDALAHV